MPGRQHHLGERHVQAAVGEIMAGGDPAARDQVAHELAVQPLEGQVDRRRQPFLAAADLPQIERAAEPAHGLADQDQGQALVVVGQVAACVEIVDHAQAADRRRRPDRLAVGLVVERDVAGDDREVERQAGLAHALDAADELAHDRGVLGLPKFRQSVSASGRAPTAHRLRQASATACMPPRRGSATQ